jgi:hypothetical protein
MREAPARRQNDDVSVDEGVEMHGAENNSAARAVILLGA